MRNNLLNDKLNVDAALLLALRPLRPLLAAAGRLVQNAQVGDRAHILLPQLGVEHVDRRVGHAHRRRRLGLAPHVPRLVHAAVLRLRPRHRRRALLRRVQPPVELLEPRQHTSQLHLQFTIHNLQSFISDRFAYGIYELHNL